MVGTALGFKSKQEPVEFRFRIVEDLGTLDWGHGDVVPIVVQQLMEGLTISGKKGQPVPALAKKWTFDPKTKTYTFELRTDSKWSDGVPVCAKDFVDAWIRTLDPEFGSPYAHYLFDIKNARAFHSGKIKNPTQIGVSAQGCSKLRVQLEHPVSYFPAITSHWALFPIRKDLIQKFGPKWMSPEKLAVTGPYLLKQWKRDQFYLLAKNPNYYGVPGKVERLRALVINDDSTALHLFKAKKLDQVKEIPFLIRPKLRRTPEYSEYPAYVMYHIAFRFDGATPLSREQRCALANGIDKAQIPDLLKGGELPAYSIIPPNLQRSLSKRLPNKVQQKLFPSSKDNKKFKLDVYYYSKDIHTPLLEWIQAQWQKNLNLKVGLIKLEQKSYWGKLLKDPAQVFLTGITASYAHAYSFISGFLSDSPANFGKYASKEYDAVALSVATENSTEVRAKQIRLAEKVLLDEDCAVIPLYFRQTTSLLSTRWGGFFINPLTYVYLKNVYQRI